jgi:hypothetical protein
MVTVCSMFIADNLLTGVVCCSSVATGRSAADVRSH